MRRVVTIDIETLPAPELFEEGLQTLNFEQPSDTYLKTALNGDVGQILCIGYVDEDNRGVAKRGVIGWDESRESFSGDEKTILTEFWKLLCTFRPSSDRIVGHNIFDFDLKFIYKRSVIHGIRPSVDLSFVRYRNQPIFDTMFEWERWSFGSKISLDKLAKVVGVESSKESGVNGSQVYELWKSGQHRKIRDYCLRDVETTRLIYRRLMFLDCSSESSLPVLQEDKSKESCASLHR